jgi:DNA (cytosine-5)-methyltransferase 1
MIKILELFGGIGAPRKALVNLGIDFKSIDYVEIDEKAVRTYNSLFDNKQRPQSVVDYNLRPDILIHGSPCQDFSRAGKRLGGNDEDKTRSSLMWETLRIIKNLGVWKPKFVIWENVKGVRDKDMIHSFEKYIEGMSELGYTSNFQVLDARNFGIPQKRERLFTISNLYDKPFDFGKMRLRPMENITSFLENNVDEKYTITSPSMLNKIGSNDGSSFGGRLKEIDKFAWTITTKQNRCPNSGIINIGNGQYRLLTEKECWRLMGFNDDDYNAALIANPTRDGCMNGSMYKQAGNSIVVNVLEAIFEVVLNDLLSEMETTTTVA